VKRTAQVKKNETVVIYGLGGLGFNALQIVLSIGARLLVLEQRPEVLAEAVNAGVRPEDVFSDVELLAKHVQIDNLFVDTAIDFVTKPGTFNSAQNIGKPHLKCWKSWLTVVVRMAGKIVVVGLLAPEITIHTYLAVKKRLHILCSYGGLREDLEEALDLISRKIITPRVEKGKMEDFPRILEDLHNGKIKSRIALVP
jgi:propanol-preferring alcohol dehydrogenase